MPSAATYLYSELEDRATMTDLATTHRPPLSYKTVCGTGTQVGLLEVVVCRDEITRTVEASERLGIVKDWEDHSKLGIHTRRLLGRIWAMDVIRQ